MQQMQFADRLRGKRCEKRMTQKELANKLDASITTVSNWEIGKATPNVECLKAICVILDTEPDYLLGWQK